MSLLGEFSPRRMLVEAAIIITSILAAFGIQAWWDDRLENEEEQRLLVALLEECRSVLPQIEANIAFHRTMVTRTNAVLEAPLSETPTFTADSLDALLVTLTASRSADFQTATLNSVLLGGRLAIIDSPEVRADVAAWQGALDEIADVADQDANRFALDLTRYLTLHANRGQLVNSLRSGDRETADAAGAGPVPEPTGKQNHFQLLGRNEFRNLVLQRRSSQEDILQPADGYPHLRATLLRLMESLRLAMAAT